MADNTENESITEVVPKALGKYLKGAVSSLRAWHDEFPSSNQKLALPSITVFAKSPVFMPSANPHLVTPIDPLNIVNSKANTLWVVGDYEFKIQLDLWCGSKEELDDLYDALFNALNPTITPMGLPLILDEYYGILCDFLYVGHSREASEITSQTDEWRITFDILATCQAIRNSKEFIIESTELVNEISKTVLIT